MSPVSENHSAARFPTTHWSRVARAGAPADNEARAALEGLCRDYWFPLYAFARHRGFSPHEAEDLVQGFLADLLERGDLAGVDRANRRDHDRAAKRGAGRTIVPIDRLDAEDRYGREPAHEMTAERLFERQWALTLLQRVLRRLEDESAHAGKSALFDQLRPALQGDDLAPSYREIAAALGLADGAVRVAAHRLRVRYREVLREEVGRTTDDPAGVDDEIADLLAALGGV
jgi:DNA-directed RNA polymerase specialized sigma24 family protein